MFRPCLRGCTVKGKHVETHPAGTKCPGCVPVDAADGAMICERCVSRLRSTLDEVPDVCAHLRSMVDPMRSGWNMDRDMISGPSSGPRPPLNVELVEAADEVLRIVVFYAEVFGDEMDYRGRHQFAAGVGSEDAYHAAKVPVGFLLANLGWIVNDRRVLGLCRAVLGPGADAEDWTVGRVLARWPLRERARFVLTPCPGCGLRTILGRPPRVFGGEKKFECVNPECGWVPPDDEAGLWAASFEGVG